MSSSFLMTIALLCQATGYAGQWVKGESADKAYARHLQCQQDYIKCMQMKEAARPIAIRDTILTECILERKVTP